MSSCWPRSIVRKSCWWWKRPVSRSASPGSSCAAGGYLRLVALAPGYEGQGHGGALLDEMERRIGAVSRHVFLLVSRWNVAAQRFYQHRGYREVGALPAFVLPDTDELILWKR